MPMQELARGAAEQLANALRGLLQVRSPSAEKRPASKEVAFIISKGELDRLVETGTALEGGIRSATHALVDWFRSKDHVPHSFETPPLRLYQWPSGGVLLGDSVTVGEDGIVARCWIECPQVESEGQIRFTLTWAIDGWTPPEVTS